ncbi:MULTISPECIES: MarR family winged helix-turn-helix transcriptional regulator [Bosea]|uniref:MarR family winged helix-turn-helix transcriptional regulator n=1 Tax=Bosea TaxID=85413 RepID=UPI0021501722|nr:MULTISPECIES: MarR family winged helix-turn-helix transcriptional regulator [Bosea]MCR4522238.1 MarR family winged helix-turn-helix transcriptional regulator [Bosea sp. 47.2.35]MDR6828110.1 DNA-binding MarR family transcriptional regulator [Bosea robiniae]MDR6894740.1 DNA-binding MarR family transcriptional regulator [Bosea sp. BE109]MDR7138216.1 DNA-binding MarR family transcriptional regulator [Bosea sp. BE168]MDR7174915.1 DNA-binding MarR family transcriptional regulator [Bosea sp. BE271
METPGNPTLISHRLREAFARVATVMRIDDWERAKRAGINPTQLAILELLEGREGGLCVKEIAAHLGVSQPTATDSINALVRKGAVEKRAVAGDGRAVAILLTSEGKALLAADATLEGTTGQAVDALGAAEQERLLLSLIRMIREFQEAGAIPIQRMCASCQYFAPFAHPGAARPHHCRFVDAAFGQRELRIDCRDHQTADPASRAATWEAFQAG